MTRTTGTYRITRLGGEDVRAYIPAPLPPAHPALRLDDKTERALAQATTAVGKLVVAADMVPSADWFLYGFVRKEALITSQIEGTQATLQDLLAFEAGDRARRAQGRTRPEAAKLGVTPSRFQYQSL